MPFTVTTPDACFEIDADEHRVEGLFHVFRRGTTVMGHPRMMVVRRLRADAVLTVSPR